jgi:hypothetical protein
MDCFLSEHRESAAAKPCVPQAMETRGRAQTLTREGDAASQEAGSELQQEGSLPAELPVRTSR